MSAYTCLRVSYLSFLLQNYIGMYFIFKIVEYLVYSYYNLFEQILSGLDLLAYEPESNTLRLVEAKKLNVSWYVYTHESRLILLASGTQCKLISGFQVRLYC